MPEPIDMSDFVPNVRAFLSALAQNNDRDWFKANKATYDTDLKRPAERILTSVTPALEARAGTNVRSKLFRPHRDIRFSDDKTPFHTHLHMLWSLPDGRGWYFGLAADYATAGLGMMAFDSVQLDSYRVAVDGPDGDILHSILTDLDGRMDEPPLKRVPKPYAAEHRHAALLRRKGLVLWRDDVDARLARDPTSGLLDAFDELQPLQDWLGRNVSSRS